MEKGCCHTETKKEKILLFTSIGLAVFAIAMIIALIVIATTSDKNNICETKTCLEAATKIVQHMDTTVDPCKNFYDYACGNYGKRIITPEYEPSNAHEEMLMEAQLKLTKLLEEPPQHDEPKIFTSVKDFFSSCMNTTQINALGLRPIKYLLKELGGCPLIDGNSWNPSAFSWTNTLTKFRKLGLKHYGIFSISVDHDYEKPEKRIIKIQVTPMIVPVDTENESMLDHPIAQLLYNLSVLLGADKSRAQNHFREVVELIVKIGVARKLYEPEERKMTANDLQKFFPHISWVNFLNSLGFPKVLSRNEEILVVDPNFVSKVSSIISREETRVIANTIIFDAVMQVLYTLDDKVDDLLINVTKASGLEKYVQILTQRRLRCLHFTAQHFSVASAAMYISSDDFNFESKPMVEDIFDNVVQEVYDGITNIQWLRGDDIEAAENKIKSLHSKIGYPEALLHDGEIKDYYSDIVISKDQFFYNYLNLTKNSMDQKYKLLTKRTDEARLDELSLFPIDTFDYQYAANTINILATSLEKPYFDVDWPNYLNYGAIGTRIGRNLMYAIDPSDKYSYLSDKYRYRWSNRTIDKYTNVENCINKQYENFLIRLNTIKKETGGDPGTSLGVSYAYKAYVKLEKENKLEMLLPSLRLTSRQLFWISMANTWCAEGNGDVSPSVYSTLSTALINSPDFARDFNCPEGSFMNPQKC